MSVYGMAAAAAARRIGHGTEITTEATDSGRSEARVADAARTIVLYIPTEIITVYVAAATALGTDDQTNANVRWALVWIMLCLTPFAVWATFAARLKSAGEPLPLHPTAWPWGT